MDRNPLHTPALLLLAAMFAGCSVFSPVADFTKQRYTNTIAYFNTFYNAQRAFDDAEQEVLKSRREFLERAGQNRAFVIPSSARSKFQTSIEKNSKVLSFYADSKWVDDALFMIGKAYAYMEDDVRAERKFQELATQFPNSEMLPESRLWLARGYLRQKNYASGIKTLEELTASSRTADAELAGDASYELAQYYFSQKQYQLAAKNYRQAAELVTDDELLTQVHFQLGKCSVELQQYAQAMTSFEEAAGHSPLYTWIFQADLQRIKTEALLKNYDAALDALHDMLQDSKNTEFFGIIHFEIANVLSLQGKMDDAEAKYRFVDTAFARSEEAARSYFVLAKYYEEQKLNYDSARVFYNRAKVEFTNSDVTPLAVSKADMFNKHHDLWADLNRYDSLYRIELDRVDPADTMKAVPADTVMKRDTVTVKEETKGKKGPKGGKAELRPEGKKDSVSFAADSVRIKARILRDKAKMQMLDSLLRSVARTKFELGGLFFLEIQNPDSAVKWFDDVIINHPKTIYAPRSLYTKAEIYRTQPTRSKMDLEALYKDIIGRYGDSPYANEARKGLGIPLIEAEKDTAAEQYEAAEAIADKGDGAGSAATYKRLAQQFPSSAYAPKALYAAGWLYEFTMGRPDSAIAVYRRLLERYPATSYAGAAQPKVAAFDEEMKRIEDEKKRIEEEKKQAEEQKKREADEAAAKEKQEKEGKAPEPSSKPEAASSDSLSTPKRNQ